MFSCIFVRYFLFYRRLLRFESNKLVIKWNVRYYCQFIRSSDRISAKCSFKLGPSIDKHIFDFEKNQSCRLKQFENGPTLKCDKDLSVGLEILGYWRDWSQVPPPEHCAHRIMPACVQYGSNLLFYLIRNKIESL